MEPIPSISRLGFRKWYERQLIDGHAALITCVLCMVAVAVCLEEFTFPAPITTITLLLGIVVGASYLALRSWQRYREVMLRAWRYGERAVCAECRTYGRFKVLTSGITTPPPSAEEPDPQSSPWMNVACRHCGHLWRMPD